MFGIPSILAGIFAAIAIGSYKIASTNTMGEKFPYIQILKDPLTIGGKQFAMIPITILMATATGIITGLILKFTADNN